MKVNLDGKVAVITGSTSGIGRGIALMFAQNGAGVVVNGNNEERGNAVVQEIKASGGKAIFIRANVGDRQETETMAERVLEEFGTIDILVNNAGINIDVKDRGPIHEFPDEM